LKGVKLTEARRVEFPNWFASTPAQENFEKLLHPFKGHTDLQFLQLGAFTGDASVWLLDNILTDPSNHLTDVDTWQGSDEEEHHKMNFSDVESAYDYKIRGYKNLTKFKGSSIEWLKAAPLDYYDFIYIDADHTAVGVLLDAELSWLCLKPGGVIAFDDYEWSDGKGDAYRPMPGINTFVDRHKNELTIIHKDWQLWVVKA
jgi:predicted O-methyltransferase YrrM